MQLQRMQSDEKTQFHVRVHHTANKYALKGEKWDPHLESSRQDPKNQRCPNAPTFGERSIDWTLFMQEMARTSAWTLHQHVCNVPRLYSENRHWFFKPSPASNASAPPMRTSRERDFVFGSGASLHVMRKSDLTSKAQETVRKSKDPAVITTANGTTHTADVEEWNSVEVPSRCGSSQWRKWMRGQQFWVRRRGRP